MINRFYEFLRPILWTQTFFTLILRGLGVLVLFTISLLLTNNFEPDVVGEYEFIRVFLLVIGSICLVGSDISIIYFAGKLNALKKFSSISYIYYNFLKIICSISLILFLLFLVFGSQNNLDKIFSNSSHSLLLKTMACLVFYVISIFNAEVLRAINQAVLSEFFRNIFKYVPLAAGVFFQITFPNKISIAEFYVYGFIGLFVLSQIAVIYHLKKIPVTEYEIRYKPSEILKISFPMGVSSIIMFLLLSIDIFLLKKYFGNEIIAYYAVAIKLITLLSIIIISININISAKISELYTQSNLVKLQSLCTKTAKNIFFINLGLSILMIVFIDPILTAFGEQYLYIKNAFYILIASQLFTSAFGALPIYLNMTGRGKVFQWLLLMSLVLNIAINIILIPKYGVVGAAIAFSSAVVFWNIVAVLYIYKKDRINLSFL